MKTNDGGLLEAAYILNVSGGKDSTALLLWAMEQGIDFLPVFADTGNENAITLDYVRDLPRRTGCPAIKWIKADFRDAFTGRRKRLPEKWRRDGVPEDRIKAASKRGAATFFAVDKIPGPHQKDHSLPVPAMADVVRWSMTARGGRQFDLFAQEEPPSCSSPYGLCE